MHNIFNFNFSGTQYPIGQGGFHQTQVRCRAVKNQSSAIQLVELTIDPSPAFRPRCAIQIARLQPTHYRQSNALHYYPRQERKAN